MMISVSPVFHIIHCNASRLMPPRGEEEPEQDHVSCYQVSGDLDMTIYVVVALVNYDKTPYSVDCGDLAGKLDNKVESTLEALCIY